MDETTLTECCILSSTMNASCSQTPRTFFKDKEIGKVLKKNEDSDVFSENVSLPRQDLIEERRIRLFEKLNKRHENNIDNDETKVATPFCGNEENIDYDTRKQKRLFALEKRDNARRKAIERSRIERLEKEQKIDIVETTKKFLGEDENVTTSVTMSHIDLTVTYTGSMLNNTELLSKTSVIDSKEETDRRNALALVSWINQLLGVDKESCEDMHTFSEKARHKADEMLKNSLKNSNTLTNVLVNFNNSSVGLSKKAKQWMESVSKARNYLKSFGFLNRIKDMVESNPNIAVDNLKIFVDFGMQQEVINVLLSFNPTWLRLALECIFNVDLNIVDYSSSHNLFISFITTNVFSSPHIINSKKFCPTGTKASITQLGIKKLQWNFITKMLQIVTIIEFLQGIDLVVPENPPMFAIHSTFKSSKDVIMWMRKTFISRKFDLSKALSKIGIIYKYEQKFYDSYVYIVKDLKTDLCDGVILAKVLEIIFKITDHSLLSLLRPPSGDRLRKVGNVKSVLKFAKDHDLDIGNVKVEDIVQGKMLQITELLWKMIGVFVAQKDQYKVFRRVSQRIRKLASHLEDPYGTVPKFLSGFDIVLHVSKQFAQLKGLEVPQGIEDFNNGYFLIHIYDCFYAKYGGMDVKKFDGRTLTEKAINIAHDELGISKDLLSLEMISRGDYRTLELFVKVFMEKCLLVMDLEESAFTLQRFFKGLMMKKNCSMINIKDYSCKWYGEREKTKMIKDIAATKIQAIYRTYRARKNFAFYKSCVVRIQSIIRGFLARIKLKKHRCNMNFSAVIIQRAWRRFSFIKALNKIIDERRKILNDQKKILASKIIQRSWKRYKLRKNLKRLIVEQNLKEKFNSIVPPNCNKQDTQNKIKNIEKIQLELNNSSCFDNINLKDSIEDFIPRLAMYYLEQKEKTEIKILAAIKIQAWYRGVSVRQKLGNEIHNIRYKMEKLKQEVAENIDLDISDLNISVHNRFSRICEMLNSTKVQYYKKAFLQLARLLRLSPSLGFYFVQVNGHKSLSGAIGRLKRSPIEQEINSLFSEILYYLLLDNPCYRHMKGEIIEISNIIWHYFYAHYTNVEVVYYLGNCILLLKKHNAPSECFKNANFYINEMNKRFTSLSLNDKRSKTLKKLQSVFY